MALEELTTEQILLSVWQALSRLEGTVGAALDRDTPAPQVTVSAPPVDLTDIVTAVTGLKPGPTADEIARAIAGVISPTGADPAPGALAKVAEALEKLDFRLQGMGTQAYGGGSVTMAPGQILDVNLVGGSSSTTISVDPNNSTTNPLAAGAEFTGIATDISAYNQVNIEIFGRPSVVQGDGSSAMASFFFEFSPDGTNWDISVPALIRDPGLVIPIPVINVGRWFRVRYLNDGGVLAISLLSLPDDAGTPTEQTEFRLQSQLLPNATKELARTLDQSVSGSDAVSLTRGVQMGKPPTGDFVNLPVGGHDPLNYVAALDADETFVGTYRRTHGYSSALAFAFGDKPLADIKVQWSSDGTNARPGLISTSSLLTSETLISGFYVYIATITTMVDAYARFEMTNGAEAQGVFEADIWWYDDPFPGSFGGLEANLSTLSTALLTRAVQAGTNPNGEFLNARFGGEVDALTTTDLLVADATYTSAIVGAEGYTTVGVALRSDQDSAVNGLLVRWWADAEGTNLLRDVLLGYDSAPLGVFYQVPVQGPYVQVVYTNGPIGQNEFALHTQFDAASPGPLMQALGDPVNDNLLGNIVRSIITVQKKTDDAYHMVKSTASQNVCVSIEEATAEVPIKSLSSWRTNQANVPFTTPVQLIGSPLSGRRSFAIKNLGTGQVYLRESSGVSISNSWPLDSRESIVLELDENSEVWALGEDEGATTSSTREDPSTITNNGATNPNNALLSDDSRAALTATAQSLEASGFSAPGAEPDIQSVTIGFEGRKATSPTTETVAHVATVSNTAASGTAVTSPTVTVGTGRVYIAAVAAGNAAATVTSVVGLGLTWTEINTTSNDDRVSMWRAVDVNLTATSGTVTANFSAAHSGAGIIVSRFSGVDRTAPIDAQEVITGTGASYSDSVAGTDQGLVVVAVSSGRQTHTAGGGATERDEVSVGTGANEVHLALTTRPLSATGPAAYSGTLGGSVGYAIVAATLEPRPADNPIVTLSYELDGVPGASTLQVELDSTGDSDYEVDITGDAAFVAADIADIHVFVTADTVTAVDAEVDHIYIDLVEVGAGGAQRVAWVEVAT